MKDEEILRLYRQRDEQAIAETQKRYGALCYTIACNVLRDRGDAEECVNDTWRRAWDRIPPDEPQSMAAYLGRVTRNLALNRLQKQNRLKRGGGEMTLIWEELAELIPAGETPETQWERQAFGRVLDDFLRGFRARQIPPIPHKAMLTLTNTAWTGYELYDNISREMAAIKAAGGE